MLNILEECYVKSYVRVCYLFGSNLSLDEKKKIADYFTAIYNLKESYEYQEMTSFLLENDFNLNDVNLFLRRCQYRKMTHFNDANEKSYELELDIVTAVSEEIKSLNNIKITNEGMKISLLNCYNILNMSLKSNYVQAYFIYSVLYTLGIFGNENIEKGNEYLTKISHWNVIEAMLCLSYNKKDNIKESLYWYKLAYKLNKENYISKDRLKELEELAGNKITKEVDVLLKHDLSLHKIISDERGSENVNPQKYNSSIDRVIYYGNFSLIEKQTLIYSKVKIDFSKIELLVFEDKKIKLKNVVQFTDFREKEIAELSEILTNMTKTKNQFPLVIIAENYLLIDLYKSFIKQFLHDYIYINIDAKRTDPNSLLRQMSSANIFYQEMVDKQNSHLLIVSENMHLKKEVNLSLFTSYLDPLFKYSFSDIIITLDKSDFINVIFTKNLQQLDSKLTSICKVFETKKISKDEYERFIALKLLLSLGKTFTEDEYSKIATYIVKSTTSDKFLSVINNILSLTNPNKKMTLETIYAMINDFTKKGKNDQIGFVIKGDNNESD